MEQQLTPRGSHSLAFLASGSLGESIIPAINKLQDVFSQVGACPPPWVLLLAAAAAPTCAAAAAPPSPVGSPDGVLHPPARCSCLRT